MKKIKWILLFIMILLAVLFLFATCKKTKALESGFTDYNIFISERDVDKYGYVAVYGIHTTSSSDNNFNYIYGTDEVIFINNYHNDINVYRYTAQNGYINLNNFTSKTGLIQVIVDYDVDGLYLIIYELNVALQHNQGQVPVSSQITRTLKGRISLGNSITSIWNQGDLTIKLFQNNVVAPSMLLNYSYFEYGETINNINNWVDNQSFINLLYNNLIVDSYLYGNVDGYDDGFSDGEDRGYNDGYDDGEDAGYLVGHADGYQEGANAGYTHGYDEGYREGYDDGQEGETAITPAFNILSGVFGVVASVFQIELVPHVPLGLFFLVPLFFSAIGLILWIWRRN